MPVTVRLDPLFVVTVKLLGASVALSSSSSVKVSVSSSPLALADATAGRTPSTFQLELASLGKWSRSTAALAAVVAMELPVGVSKLLRAKPMPSLSLSPSTTVYSRRKVLLPEPDT